MPYDYSEDRRRPGLYHVWVRGRKGVWLFRDDEDRRYFEYLIDRHLASVPPLDSRGRPLEWLYGKLRQCARNLLSSHFHQVLWQTEPGMIERLMHNALGAYSRYYRAKYGFSGQLYDGPYRARRIEDRPSLRWRIAYVHFNHKGMGLDWEFSTHRLFMEDADPPGWLAAQPMLRLFGGRDGYLSYLEQYRKLRLAR